jgi:DNA ligase-1
MAAKRLKLEGKAGTLLGPAGIKPVMLAHKWDPEKLPDPTGWWVSEKYDGQRVYWNGEHLCSRTGNYLAAPKWYLEMLKKVFGDVHADGEAWLGRKKFDEVESITRSTAGANWEKLLLIVFDLPEHPGTFEERMAECRRLVELHPDAPVEACPSVEVPSREALDSALDKMIAAGGEGLMIRKPGSKYERRRSRAMLKCKKMHDEEATVIGYVDMKGHDGMMGALTCKNDDGAEFGVGTGFKWDDRRYGSEKCPKIGARITYRYQEKTKRGNPRFPAFVRLHNPV